MSVQLVKKMRDIGIIKTEDMELHIYGIEVMQLKLTAGIFAFVISLFLRTTGFFFLLLLFLVPIRRYAGGVHAKSKCLCLVATETILIMAEMLYRYHIYNEISNFIMIVLGVIVIAIKSPYESENHPLTDGQRRKYRLFSYIICAVYTLFYVASEVLMWRILQASIAFAMIIESVLLLIPCRTK